VDVAVPLRMHCLEAKLGHYAVEEVPDGPKPVDGGARPAMTMTTTTSRPARACASTNMAVPHNCRCVGWVVGF
jgi:hypothetical protein